MKVKIYPLVARLVAKLNTPPKAAIFPAPTLSFQISA